MRLGLVVLLAWFAAPPGAMACTVGDGTIGSCDNPGLDACLPGGMQFDGNVDFACGSTLTVFPVSSTKTISANTTIDGGGTVRISGNSTQRVFAVNDGITFTVENLQIENGRPASGEGGAIRTSSGTLQISNCTFTGNRASIGGAVYNGSGSTSISGSTFVDNATTIGVGGAFAGTGLTLSNSTFVNNLGVLGAVYVQSATATVTNCTFTGNPLGPVGQINSSVTLTNNIFNQDSSSDCFGAMIDGGHNIAAGSICSLKGANCVNTVGTSICNTDPGLDPAGLADNGGPTQTIALCTAVGSPASCTVVSPAIDAGDDTACAAAPVNGVDQRGFRRDPPCDVGAFEVVGPENKPAPMMNTGAVVLLAALLTVLGWRSASRAR